MIDAPPTDPNIDRKPGYQEGSATFDVEDHLHQDKAKRRTSLNFQKTAIALKWVTLLSFYVIGVFNLLISLNNDTNNTTILTQALTDWNANSWVDFVWAENTCPENYEAIGNTWLGTNPGNYTSTVVI